MLQNLAAFKENATSAIGNAGLQRALARAKPHFAKKCQTATDLLRAEQTLPRNIMLITGPSRSADIEQTLALGAHGPRRPHIMILNGQG